MGKVNLKAKINNNKATIAIVDKQNWIEFKQYCQKNGIMISFLIDKLIKDFLNKKK